MGANHSNDIKNYAEIQRINNKKAIGQFGEEMVMAILNRDAQKLIEAARAIRYLYSDHEYSLLFDQIDNKYTGIMPKFQVPKKQICV